LILFHKLPVNSVKDLELAPLISAGLEWLLLRAVGKVRGGRSAPGFSIVEA